MTVTRREFIRGSAATGTLLAVGIYEYPAFSAATEKAFVNGRIYTMNPLLPWADTVVTQGNRFVYVGSRSGAGSFLTKGTTIVDLGGKMVLPGFIESHAHPTYGSLLATFVVLNPEASREELMAEIKREVRERQKDEVIGMMGFKAALFGPDGPHAKELDAIECKKPLIILDYGGHSAWVNSRALQIAGITRETPDPIPGAHYYRRDKEGNPTGWCIELSSYAPIMLKLGFNAERINQGLEPLLAAFSSFGFTTIFDAGAYFEEESFSNYRLLEMSNRLPLRIHGCHMITTPQQLPTAVTELSRLNKSSSSLVTVNTLKIVYDGTLEAQSCAMYEEFINDKGNRGYELIPPEVLSQLVTATDDAGFNIHIHAIGNRAIADVLTAFERLKQLKGPTPTRKTICHLQFFMPDTVKRLTALKEVVAQTTPLWMVRDRTTEAAVGKELYERQALFATLDKAGVRVTFGSDFPVSSGLEGLNPFNEMEVGMLRREVGRPDTEFLPPAEERLSLETLLRGYTINGAFQLGVEKELGSIEKGKLADLIVIEKNLFDQKPSEIHTNRVIMTVMNGAVVYDSTTGR